ncbi:MAG: DNA polymerase III subunit delta [Firmicutes bacterium]|nr:DNA polymerase III subunit delta [Bacillota bacterium]
MKQAKQKPLKPVYLIYGDKKMIEDALARLKRRISAQFNLDFNFDHFNGSSDSALDIIQAANTLPFMSEKRLVVVKDADKLSADDTLKLARYAESPSKTTCLVLVAGSVNKAGKLYKAVEKSGEVAEYKLKGSLVAWIKNEFNGWGKLVSDSIAKYLLDMVGSDLLRLSVEIEKISLYCTEERIIDPNEIDPIVARSFETSVFDLAERIGERNIPKAIETLHFLLQQREPPLAILNLIARHFRLTLRAKIWVEQGRDSKYLIENLTGAEGKKLPYFAVNKYREQSYNFSVDELKKIFERILEADIALKSSLQPPEAILEDLIIQLAA